VSYRITLAGEAHTVSETIPKPCAVEIAICVLGEQTKKKLETSQLFNNTVKLSIKDLSADI
jgi:hypothetical protein